jgi:hypothetical protein
MPLLIGESMTVCRKTGFHKLQTDRSVGIHKSYLPHPAMSRGRGWTFSPRVPLLATKMFLPSRSLC